MAEKTPELNVSRVSNGLVRSALNAALEEMTAPECPLTPAKVTVLRELAAGNGVVKAAEAAGVSRRTVSWWMRNDPQFIAALNAWRNQSMQWARDQMVATLSDAAATVRRAVQNGDAKLAMQLLKLQQAVGPVEEGLESAEEIQMSRDARRRDRRTTLARREVVSMNREITRHPLYEDYCKRERAGTETRSWQEFVTDYNSRMRLARQALEVSPGKAAQPRVDGPAAPQFAKNADAPKPPPGHA